MGNFDFLKATIPDLHQDCARAESYISSDPRTACFYARRSAEELVGYLYDILRLPEPYQRDLSSRINSHAFRNAVTQGIAQKLNLIRRSGNRAVHENKPIQPKTALTLVRELHHATIWASYHHSPNPGAVPITAQFDPRLAAQSAPLTRDELVALAERFKAQDEALQKALEEKADLAAAKDAEIAALRAQIEAAQERRPVTDPRDYTEAETRTTDIDDLLREAGWEPDTPNTREFKVSGMPTTSGIGYADYVLWGADGLPLAVIEAKRTSRSVRAGERQAELYADCLETQFGRRPVIFLTNGIDITLWDDGATYPQRDVRGFYTRDELELMIQRRSTRMPLALEPISSEIAGRPYQLRAIRAVGEAFDAKQRHALLVMATGSGKTRTVVALIDQLMRAGWAKRVLFLADRTQLVKQAAHVFTTHLPSVTTVNLLDDKGAEGRIYVSTHNTMMNLINDIDGGVRRFSPGHFDLVVIDEAHRSVYAKFGEIFEYFDALLVGLTATPKDEIDHNTYRLFQLEDGVPTDAYTLEEAVTDGYLVPPRGIDVGTTFLRGGIRYDDLSEREKDEWDSLEWGDGGPPDEVDAAALNRFLFNEDTVEKVLGTLMEHGHHVAGGDRLGKTIIFAANQLHAEFISDVFSKNYPHYGGTFARVITHSQDYAHTLIDQFSERDREPHIAISVDMLDTGVDVPEVVNLVFFKQVRSKSKFWQMIGRGTRLCPDLFGPGEDKRDFLVFDFCGNLEFFNQDLPTPETRTAKSLSQRLFERRIDLVRALDGIEPQLRSATVEGLRAIVEGMSPANFVVRPHRVLVEKFTAAEAWESLSETDAAAAVSLSALPSSERDDDEHAKRFDILMLELQLAQLNGDAVVADAIRATIQNIAHQLLSATTIPNVAANADLLDDLSGDTWWRDATLPMLEDARLRVRGLVRLIERTGRNPIYSHFEDTLGAATEVHLKGITPGTDMARFKDKAAAYLRAHADHLALQKIRRNKQLTDVDLEELQRMLIESGGESQLETAAATAGSLGLFIRSLVGLDRDAAMAEFADFLDDSRYSSDQIHFIQLIVTELTMEGAMTPGRLFESPFTDHASHGPEDLFGDGDVDTIVRILRRVRRNADPAVTA